MNRKKKTIMIISVGVVLGSVIGIFKNTSGVADDVFWRFYISIGIAIVAAIAIIACIYTLQFNLKLQRINKLILVEEDFDSFLEAVNREMEKRGNLRLKNLLRVSLSFGYGSKGEYEKGIEVLEEVDEKLLNPINKIVYYLNLASFSFYLNDYETVLDIEEKNRVLFKKYEKNSYIGWNIEANKIYCHIAGGDAERAKELLENAQNNWKNKEQLKELSMIQKTIAERGMKDE